MRKRVFPDITHLIGKTPLVHLDKFCGKRAARVAAKLEYLNPGGSIKDRAVLNMIRDAEKRGFIKPGSTIIEPTSGNTGTSLALICSVKGYRLILTMPNTIPSERIDQLKAFGVEVITTPDEQGMRGAIQKAEELLEHHPDMFMPGQFTNPSNPEAHEKTTAVEIWEDTAGAVDVVVAGVGTGGTITGLAAGLRKKKNVRVVAVEPTASATISGGKAGSHAIPGIGAGFIPRVLNQQCLDEVITVTDRDAMASARELQRSEGLPVGISSGAVAWAAKELAKRAENREKLIVIVFPDSSEKYINMRLLI